MTKCKFKYSNHLTCGYPCQIKSIDKSTSIVDKVRDKKGNLSIIRCWHPISEYEDYCHNHLKMMRGQIVPVELREIPKETIKKIAASRERWNHQFLVKKMKYKDR
uniref:Uncharacterized protein n=1 Tax=viral metagenome TaxID=1070528 RepID=A0A6M3LDZ7_9ZZZZ